MSRKRATPFATSTVLRGLELAVFQAENRSADGIYTVEEEQAIARARGWLEEAKRKRAEG